MAFFIDASGQQAEVKFENLEIYKEALAKGVSVRQLLNQKYPTQAGAPSAFAQFCASSNMRFEADPVTGIPASTLGEMLDPAASGFTSQPASPDSRILFPAAILSLIEDKLIGKEDEITNVLDSVVAYKQTISTSKFEQPVLNYQGTKGPEDSQYQVISQNTAPALMLSLTSSDVTRKVATTSIGMEISQEALQSTSMDFVGMTLARFYKMAAYNTWIDNLTYILNGDPDSVVTSYSAGTSALSTFTAQSLDSTITAAGTLTHTAYIKWLLKQPLTMQPTHIVCDINAALAIENRTGRPTNVQNNSTDRLDSPMVMLWPNLGENIKVIALPVGSFPANTLMAFDASQAIGKVTSLFSQYSAVEDMVMRKSRQIRIDKGDLYWRLYDDSFSVMTLTV